MSRATRTKPSWATKRATMELDSAKPVERSSTVREPSSGPRTVLFVIGGISWSEVRACHRVSEELNREIIIGSTRILTPSTMMDMLADIHHSSPSRRPRNPFSSRSQHPPQLSSNSYNAPPARQAASVPQRQHSSRESPTSQDRIPSRSQYSREGPVEILSGTRTVVGGERNHSIHAQRQYEPSSTTRSASLANPGGSPVYGSRQESRATFSDPQLDQSDSRKEKSRWFSKKK
jgi:syntaxin-binding protein 1